MKTNLYFFSLESIQSFASENKIHNPHYIALPDSYDRQRYSALEVAGFSEVIPCYEVYKSDDSRLLDTYVVESRTWVLRIIPTGEILRIWEKSRGKFRFFLFDRFPTSRDRGFSFTEVEEPNLIGKATDKKISAWVDYLHLERTALVNCVNSRVALNKAFTERVRAKFPDAVVRVDWDGWTTSIRFEWDKFRFEYTAMENGRFSRRVDVIYSAIPSDEELF